MFNSISWIGSSIACLALLGWVGGGAEGMLFILGVCAFFAAIFFSGIWVTRGE